MDLEELKNSICEMKISPDGISSRLDSAEEQNQAVYVTTSMCNCMIEVPAWGGSGKKYIGRDNG